MPEPSAPRATPAPKAPPGAIPPVIGDFEVLDRIGQGAMGTVFKARQRSMDRPVALKVLRPSLAGDAAYVERFWREARAAARLSHPNIVLAINVGEDRGVYYFAMEYVEGHSVGMLLKAGPFDERRALQIALQVAHALDYAWSRERIVHRDIKPGNILITPDGTAKLADLGLAHEATLEDEDAWQAEGKIVGTPLYIAPEQILRRDLDVRCDLYALGATLFHMLTGRPPYEAAHAKAVLAKHLNEPVPDPRRFRPELSDGAARLLTRLLAKDRDDRYPDAKALAADIEAVLRGESLAPRLAPALRRRRAHAPAAADQSPILLLIVVLGLMALVLAGLWRLMQRESSDHTTPRETATTRVTTEEAVDRRQAAAERAWEDAALFARSQPTEHRASIERLRAVEARFPGTPSAQRAAELRAKLEADLERKNKEALGALARRAEALVQEARYADALALFARLPQEMAAGVWRQRFDAARAAVERQAREAFQAALARGDALAEKGELDEALRAFEAAAGAAPEAWRREAADRAEAARRRRDSLAERQRAEREAAYLRVLADVVELYRGRKYDEAAQLLKTRLDAAPPERREELERETAEAARLREFMARAEKGADRLLGQTFVIRGIQGELVSVKGGRLTIRTRGGSFSEDVRNLPADQLLDLALPAYASLEAPLAAARFLVAEGNLEAADARLKDAQGLAADVAALRARGQRLATAGLVGAAARDLRDARRLLAAGDAQAAEAALRGILERYNDRPAAAALCAEAQQLLAGLPGPISPRWGYVGGRATERPAARVRNTRDDTLYLTERFGLLAYRIPVANGTYAVHLHFAETFPQVTHVGERVFSVAIERAQVLADFDIFRDAGGQSFVAVVKEFEAEVRDGELTIEFTPKTQSAMINAIEVVAKRPGLPNGAALLINCGASQDYRDRRGRVWAKDQEYHQAP